MINITIQELEKGNEVVLKGELDTAAAEEVEQKLRPLYESNGKDVVIDCTELEYIASSGLRILINILKAANSNNCKVILRHVNDGIRTVLHITGVDGLFEIIYHYSPCSASPITQHLLPPSQEGSGWVSSS